MTKETIEFTSIYHYNTLETGITLPTTLSIGESIVKVDAKVDTGATFCVFERIHGENLGLEIESGDLIKISTATSGFDAFGHNLNLSVLGFETESKVYFAKEESFYLNVLGRQGWLDRVKLGLIDYEGKLLLGEYEE